MERITRQARLRAGWALWAICAVYWAALALASAWPDSAQHRVPRLDEVANLKAAAEQQAGRWIPEDGYLQPPGTRWLLAPLSGGVVPGGDLTLPAALPSRFRLMQAAAWLGAVLLLLWRAGQGDWPLGVAALLAASSAAAMTVMRPLPEIWILLVASAHLVALRRGHARTQAVLVACGVLLRGTLVALLVPTLWSLRKRPRELALTCAVFVLPLLPVVVAQSLRLHTLAGPSLNAGINLHIGNGEGANGLFRSDRAYNFAQDPSGRRWLASLGVDVEGNAADVDRAWRAHALKTMREHPLRTLRLFAEKLRLQLIWAELPQISSWDAWTRAVPGLRVFALPFGLLVVLACAGSTALRERPELRPVALTLVALLVVHAVFFVTGRFRVVMLPALCVLGAHGVLQLSRRRLAAWICALLVTLAIQPWGLGSLRASLRSGALLEEAERHRIWAMHLGPADERTAWELESAAQRIGEARAISPRNAEIYRVQARIVLLREGRDSAIEVLDAGIRAGADPSALREDRARLETLRN